MPAPSNRGRSVLVNCAALVVVIAGMKAGRPLLVPLIVALFIAVICFPMVRGLQKRGLPVGVAVVLIVAAGFLAVASIGGIVGFSVLNMDSVVVLAQQRMDSLQESSLYGPLQRAFGEDVLDNALAQLKGLLMALLRSLTGLLSQSFIVLLMLVLMLPEAAGLPRKLTQAFGTTDPLDRFSDVIASVQSYLIIKTGVSLLTGLVATLMLWAMDIQSPVLWGFLAFVLNYIPSIGSIIAAIPAVLLAGLHGWVPMAVVATGYAGINVVLGNIVEPRLTGERIGLSAVVIVVGLIFWNWMWGPVGMLLSVPLTMTLKIFLEHNEGSRWVSVLLSSSSAPRTQSASG